MDAGALLFWHASPAAKLSVQEIARELTFGEDVEGLIDLPVREILDRLKAEFPQHEESSGALKAEAGGGSFEATWTWQYLRVDTHGLPASERERLIDVIESFECMAYEAGR